MNLFDYMRESKMESESPLASRLRPKTLDEVVGQQHIVGRDVYKRQFQQRSRRFRQFWFLGQQFRFLQRPRQFRFFEQ